MVTRLLVALGAFVTLLPAAAQAQTGLLIAAHGADSAWNARVAETVRQVHWDGPVATVFLMGPATHGEGWNDGVRRLVEAGARRIVVVPLMVSSHGGHFRQIRFYAGLGAEEAWMSGMHGMAPIEPIHPVPMVVTPALDSAPELARVLTERWQALPARERSRPLILVAHGPSTDSAAALWERDLAVVSRGISSTGVEVRVALLRDDAPAAVRATAVRDLRAMVTDLAARSRDSVTALPVLISTSDINQVRIPDDLAGLPVHLVQTSLAPSAALARWIEREGRAARVAIGGGTR